MANKIERLLKANRVSNLRLSDASQEKKQSPQKRQKLISG
jgi:hypothetical protein